MRSFSLSLLFLFFFSFLFAQSMSLSVYVAVCAIRTGCRAHNHHHTLSTLSCYSVCVSLFRLSIGIKRLPCFVPSVLSVLCLSFSFLRSSFFLFPSLSLNFLLNQLCFAWPAFCCPHSFCLSVSFASLHPSFIFLVSLSLSFSRSLVLFLFL